MSNDLKEKIRKRIKSAFESDIKYGAVRSMTFDIVAEMTIEETAKEKDKERLDEVRDLGEYYMAVVDGAKILTRKNVINEIFAEIDKMIGEEQYSSPALNTIHLLEEIKRKFLK